MVDYFYYVGFFFISACVGLAAMNIQLMRPNNRYGIKRDTLSCVDWLSFAFLAGVFGLALPFCIEVAFYNGEMSWELFFIFSVLGAFLREGVIPVVLQVLNTFGTLVSVASKSYNKQVGEELNSEVEDKEDKERNTK